MGKPSGYTRSTRELAFGELVSEIAAAMRKVAEEEGIADLEGATSRCFEMTSSKKKLFGGLRTESAAYVVTPSWLVFGACGATKAPWARCARLQDPVSVRDYEKTERFAIVEDFGVEIHGTVLGDSHRSTWFVGLGRGGAGDAFRAALRARIG